MTLTENLQETILYIKNQGVKEIDFALILGSGLGELADEIQDVVKIPYHKIPHFPVSTVVGHAGQLVYGTLSGKKVLAMQGRFHFYEGYSMETVVYPVRVIAMLKAHSLIVTNASGGVNTTFEPGDLMLITDQINNMGTNPLIGMNVDEMGPRFPDMSQAFDGAYQKIAVQAAEKLNIQLRKGIYMGGTGPSYETPAEIHFARKIGADGVGMSTVPEVIVAVHSGLRVLGISCITNLAAGMQEVLNHEEVIETTERVKADFKTLIKEILLTI
ncbi:purine-nucleoside phosphorylase [Enterococcus sp. BWB1-3]|uniref:purine-nucleoside phosphorylase n=1 Tax=unclassified Enterococcus TaxID=2608891 RepID=UPI001922C5ED|nr:MULTISPECIES: purine-nucleoside phosphorylase [unclassified Enterococcus]MBL1227808.1 purine-nucleoside phosphorylase [Enterococcus sp. BWB1-3]MCB5953300.1 purine-nucleoside phosphorylase [Enterococcus sp. BWT-B8]